VNTPYQQTQAGLDYIKARYGSGGRVPTATDWHSYPIRAWLLPGTGRAYRRCLRWHGHWRKTVGNAAVDCGRCGIRWSW
jgi:SLT domain-containing protein